MTTKLLKNGTVLSWDETSNSVKVLSNASILIRNDRIAAIDEDVDNVEIPKGTEVVDVEGKIVSPGFINTHVHAWQTAYRTLGPDIFVVQYFLWLSQMSPAINAFRAGDIYYSGLEGYLDGLNGGVTSFVDHAHCNWNRDVMEAAMTAAVDSGARIWYCYDVTPREDFTISEQWDIYREMATNRQKSTVELGLSWDGLAHSSEEEFQNGLKMVKELDLTAITTHHIGGPWPVGDNGPSFLVERGLHDSNVPIIFSHAGYLTEAEMKDVRDKNLYISITPESEFHHGHGQTTGHLISDHASLGCDGNWTYSGDILGQARLWLQSTRHQQYLKALKQDFLPNANPMVVEDAFLLATRQGGRALRRDDVGVLRVGAKADVVVWNGTSPNMLGWSNPIAAVILHANIGDVEHVIVDGEWRKRDFKLVMKGDQSWEEVKTKFVDASKRVQDQLRTPPQIPSEWFGKKIADVEKAVSTRV